ncbi:MAG TPA: thioredoxin domain-containing protein [Pyrinomonadaceae bacterium]|jgi:protein-disulfide isomerase
MKIRLLVLILCLFSISSVTVSAQEVLAKIGERDITLNEINPQVKAATERLPIEIAKLRKSELEKEINKMLFAAEAAALKTTQEKLLEAETAKKLVKPSDEQIKAVYEANRAALGDLSLAEASGRIAAFLIRDQEEQISLAFAERLKQKYKVAPGVDVNAPNLKATDVLATVAGKPILAANFNERLKPLEYDLRYEAYDLKRQALGQAVFENMILAESTATNLPTNEIIQREVSDKMRDFTDVERSRLNQALFDKLRAKHKVQILLIEPEAPVLKISADDDPAKGNQSAPVTIVMFSDFQCPACARTHPVLEEVLKQYLPNKARFVVRDFPLMDLHPQAFRAAEAAAAANAQGKFFEFIDVLYKNQKALDDASLKRYAAEIGLDVKRFEADLASNRFAAEIRKDREDGINYGIKGTPTIFVNGVRVNELSAEAFKTAIEKALTKK